MASVRRRALGEGKETDKKKEEEERKYDGAGERKGEEERKMRY